MATLLPVPQDDTLSGVPETVPHTTSSTAGA
jgi:hypothetical protein